MPSNLLSPFPELDTDLAMVRIWDGVWREVCVQN